MKHLSILCIAVFAAVAAPVKAQTLPTTTEQVFAEFGEKVRRQDFSGLDAMYETYRQTKAKTTDGVQLMARYQSALAALPGVFSNEKNRKKDPGKDLDQANKAAADFAAQWVKHNPKSAPAHFAVVDGMLRSGWKARGGGYASKVTEAGWMAFRLAGANMRNHLETKADFARNDGYWYALMINAAVAEGLGLEKMVDAYTHGLTVDPQNFQLQQTIQRFTQERWGGSAELTDALIEQAADFVKGENAKDGDAKSVDAKEYFTRFRWLTELVDKTPEAKGVIGDKKQHWLRVREGFDVIVKKYPTAWNMNHFARFACIAGDMKTAGRVYEMMGPHKIIPELWQDFPFPCVVPYHPDILAKLRSAAPTPAKADAADDVPALRK